MKDNFKELKRKQVFESIENGTPFSPDELSAKIRDLRKSLGLTQVQMAKRLGIKQASYLKMEKNADKAQLGSIIKALRQMGSMLQISFKPAEPYILMIKKQARIKAEKILRETYSNMAMEEQSPSKAEYEKRLEELADELAKKPDSGLWE